MLRHLPKSIDGSQTSNFCDDLAGYLLSLRKRRLGSEELIGCTATEPLTDHAAVDQP